MSWLNRKNDIKELKYNVEHYSDRDTYILDCEDTEATIKAEYREYFVGYFENSRPIVIYFRYNGDDDIVFGECAKTFEAYDNDTKCNILLHILYEIYIGSKEYIACASIDEVFTEIMVNNLKSIFEENKHEYIISTEEKKLVRKKIK